MFPPKTCSNEIKHISKEALLGETFALRAYERTLKQDLPGDLRSLLSRQYEEVCQAKEQIHLMRGKERVRLLVRLFHSPADADLALREMSEAGIHPEMVSQTALREIGDLYRGRGTTLPETLFAGGVGGAWWGSLIGLLAGWSAEYSVHLIPFGSAASPGVWAWIALLGCVAGALMGSLLGLFVGIGILEEDQYLYEQSLRYGQVLLFVRVKAEQAWFANQLMAQINRQARTKSATVPV